MTVFLKAATRLVFDVGLLLLVFWAAANGGVTHGGLRGVWLPFPEIGGNRPFSPFFCLFRPFPEGLGRLKSTWKIQKTEEKGLFPQMSSDFLEPPSLKPPFAAPQVLGVGCSFLISGGGWWGIDWAELGGGGETYRKQDLARMACRKPFFETLGKRTEVRGVGNCFPRGSP